MSNELTVMNFGWRRLGVVLAAVLVVVGCATSAERQAKSSGDLATISGGPKGDSPDAVFPEMDRLVEAMMLVRRFYVDEKEYKDLVNGALYGMLSSLDPHSSFMESDAYDDMREETQGRFGGIGIHIGMRDGRLTIIAPIEGTPGYNAGLHAGDAILSIDSERTDALSLEEAVKRMRGEKGTSVVLVVRGEDDESPRSVTIVRDVISVPSVRGARLLEGKVGYVRITQFAEPTAGDLHLALNRLVEEGMQALVVDLRNNPGGLLRSAIEVSSLFLKRNAVVVLTKGRHPEKDQEVARAEGPFRLVDMPIVVLVNGGSASASEIVAGALQDHRRAVILGSTTFGKASVQSVIPLKDDGSAALRLTVARYYTPNGRGIHDQGIEPDIVAPLSAADWRRVQIRRAHLENPELFNDKEKLEHEAVVDTQLQRALDVLEAVKVFR